MDVTIYGIPTCGTVKKARRWLDGRGIAYTWVDFRATPPEPERVARWFETFGAKAMRNTSSGAYRKLPADKKSWPDEKWLAALQADPMLIKRPVVEVDGEPVLIGFKEPAWVERFGA